MAHNVARRNLMSPIMVSWRNSTPFWCKASLCMTKTNNFRTQSSRTKRTATKHIQHNKRKRERESVYADWFDCVLQFFLTRISTPKACSPPPSKKIKKMINWSLSWILDQFPHIDIGLNVSIILPNLNKKYIQKYIMWHKWSLSKSLFDRSITSAN